MIKLITLLTRKPGLSREEFIDYYEANHRVIGEKYLSGYAVKYQRRFLSHLEGAILEGGDPPFDVLMEIWFPDQATFDRAMAHLQTPEAQAEILADEEKLFDREKMRSFTVEEYESELPPLPA